MGLKVIGSGLGRTGTKSLQTALNRLGMGPCHHMVEVMARPDSMGLWIRAARGEAVWDKALEDFSSVVDWPGARYWRQLADHYPDAKVIHTTRDPDAWFASTQATIFSPESLARFAGRGAPRLFFESFTGELWGRLDDHEAMTGFFRRHEAEVRATIPPERLLVYEAGSGWEPLCAFLGVPVPDEPYPSENSRTDFRARLLGE